ncbi:hypothetical protein PGB90_003977 [Kerria lacca]
MEKPLQKKKSCLTEETSQKKKSTKQLFEHDSSSDEENIAGTLKFVLSLLELMDQSEIILNCTFSGIYSEDNMGEVWITCQKCSLHAHEVCARREGEPEYLCEFYTSKEFKK